MPGRLNSVNDIKIYSVFESEFSAYGKALENYDFSEMADYVKEKQELKY